MNDKTQRDFLGGAATTMGSQRNWVQVTIPSGQTLATQAIDMAGYGLIGIEMPAAFTGTLLQFQTTSREKTPETPVGTYQPLYDSDDARVEMTVAASRNYSLVVDDLVGVLPWPYIRLEAGSVQGADRTFTIVLLS